ncbi:GDP-mannose-dependent alpha-(1-6)-phosphatidylinositol monomannoside mannosyltransferase [Pirellulimonas nuda]|uniref:GDP-mannose-dependent alpha-(1-6)-phosphatidylinositol monomannoside mannosyltransferase n=1 Tax=Pirellulimonas nuda TaxID=2528009 RepID=A0A518DCY9_9BACT|nr:glycosyltransferase family 4 protein [Pirellulimonas nuda]QDU89352.1 GDP-mannose-dependent alpha-(1-6)-phosphatidylinositol monomannoside mannosyltransferase [Pirellulimonas nuda]
MIHYITTDGVGNATVANELRQLDRAGIPYRLHAMRRPGRLFHTSDWANEISRQTHYLYPLPLLPVIWSAVLAPFIFGTRCFAAGWNALTGERESLRGRLAGIAHFLVACHWARSLRRSEMTHLHSQWAHSGATIGMYGAWLLGKPFSFTGHACDLFRDRVALGDKIRRAEFIVCISEFHREFFLAQGARPEQLFIAYCGIDTTHFVPERKTGRGGPFKIVSVSRLVEKKGYRYMLEACRLLLDRGVEIECVIGGSGPLAAQLQTFVQELGLAEHVAITGKAVAQEDLPSFYHWGDVFCLPCVWAADQDVDGLPQTLMEAMACEIPVVSTRLVGIPDLVLDGETGLLVEAEDAQQLAAALEKLQQDAVLRERLGAAGRAHVLQRFNVRTCLDPLLDRYRDKLRGAGSATVAEEAMGVEAAR